MSLEQELAFDRLDDPPVFQFIADNPPLYSSKNGNYMFILVSRQTANGGKIVKYNLDTQTIAATYTYPSNLYIEEELGFIDVENDIIYIISHHPNMLAEYVILRSFNFETNQWNTSICNNGDIIRFPQAIFIQSPLNELHLIDKNTHFKYDATNKLFIKLQDNIGLSQMDYNGGLIDATARFIYNKSHHQLMIFQGNLNDILTCRIQDKNQQIFNWEKCKINLPRKEPFRLYNVVLGWNQVLFWFHFTPDENDGSIWALDLFHPNKWFQLKYEVPNKCSTTPWPYTITDKQNNVHLMTFDSHNGNGPYHYRASLHDLLPAEIVKLNRQKYHPLVFGYVRTCEKNNSINIYFYLKKLILEYYPIFV